MKGKVRKIIIGSFIGVTILAAGIKTNHEMRLISESKEVQTAIEGSQMVSVKNKFSHANSCLWPKVCRYRNGKVINVKNGRIHAVIKETSEAEDTIVFLHGLGMGDTTITANRMFEKLEETHNIFLMDRYGNGLSDDCCEDQTVDVIVDSYRSVLQQTGQKTPYILIAHSISGIYATYWAQQHPEEIKAVIYLDADPVECYVQEGKIDNVSLLIGKSEAFLADMGLQRLFISDETLLGDTQHQVFTKQENLLRKYLMYHNTASKATCSEMEWYYENAQTVLEEDKNLQVPQLYLVANNVQGEYYDEVYANRLYERCEGDEEQVQEKIEDRLQLIEEKKNYRSKEQNVKIVEVSGPHCLYEYKPEQVEEIIVSFLEKLDCGM